MAWQFEPEVDDQAALRLPSTFGPTKPRDCPRCRVGTVRFLRWATLHHYPGLHMRKRVWVLTCNLCGHTWTHRP